MVVEKAITYLGVVQYVAHHSPSWGKVVVYDVFFLEKSDRDMMTADEI